MNRQVLDQEAEENMIMGIETMHMAADDAKFFEGKKTAIKKKQREKNLKLLDSII